MEENSIKSYHVFLYPFLIKDESIKWGGNWNQWSISSIEDNPQTAMDDYMVGQYFNVEARNLFQNEEAEGCKRYKYNEKIVHESKYVIDTYNSIDSNRNNFYIYKLPIRDIELFVFHNNVGILKIEIENRITDTLADIRRINEYGRRIILPYIPRANNEVDINGHILCAGKLGVEFKGNQRFVKNFRDCLNGWNKYSCVDYKAPDFIYALLLGEYGNDIDDKLFEENVLNLREKMQADIDDRMYVCSLVKNDDLAKIAKRWEQLNINSKEQKEFYTLAYANDNEASCQNPKMRKKLLDKAVYTRWSDYGTLYSVTNSVFLCTTSTNESKIKESVIRPFITEYCLMVILVLAQKVSITDFSQQAAECSSNENLLADKSIRLHENYVRWDNREYLVEITEQEQGIDIYRLLQEQLGVQVRMERLQGQLQRLYTIANVKQGNKLNRIAANVSITAILLALFAIFVDITLNLPNLFDGSDGRGNFDMLGYIIAAFLIVEIYESCKKVIRCKKELKGE